MFKFLPIFDRNLSIREWRGEISKEVQLVEHSQYELIEHRTMIETRYNPAPGTFWKIQSILKIQKKRRTFSIGDKTYTTTKSGLNHAGKKMPDNPDRWPNRWRGRGKIYKMVRILKGRNRNRTNVKETKTGKHSQNQLWFLLTPNNTEIAAHCLLKKVFSGRSFVFHIAHTIRETSYFSKTFLQSVPFPLCVCCTPASNIPQEIFIEA